VQKQLDNISIDDAVLVRRCRQGDSSALTRLIVKYQDRIYNTILKICGNPDDAAELTQETFVKVIEHMDSFRGSSTFYTWLFRIAVNLSYNHCRRRVKIATVSLDAVSGDSEFGSAKAQLGAWLADERVADPAVLAQNREVIHILTQCLARIDDDHRVVLVLRDIEGMSYAEIAEALEVELGTVKSRLSRARAQLREVMETALQ
jgi:RNA polymerase sigma-70 factor, ECF subfamily